jgi:hypothetical protein
MSPLSTLFRAAPSTLLVLCCAGGTSTTAASASASGQAWLHEAEDRVSGALSQFNRAKDELEAKVHVLTAELEKAQQAEKVGLVLL